MWAGHAVNRDDHVMASGELHCGDNLEVLTTGIPPESVDLVYLDPPFNSQRTYNIVYKDQRAQEEAFKDFWSWEEAASKFHAIAESTEVPQPLRTLLSALHDILIENDSDQLAYLTMMTPRLVALHRVLKPTGSLYLHCDPTASHYLKLLLDTLFGADQFFSQIIWKRYGAHGDAHRYGAVHDVILYYGKTSHAPFNKQFVPYSEEYAASRFRHVDENGRRYQEQNLSSPNPRPNLTYPYTASNGVTYQPHANGWKCEPARMKQLDDEGRLHFPKREGGRLRLKMYLDESEGVPVQDVWTDILLPSTSPERLGYPTQKPLALLERILASSSKPSDLVLDPFCGCGTTVEAAERLGRRWIGIDIATKAIEVIESRFARLNTSPPPVIWHPVNVEAAVALAERPDGKGQFERWAVRKVGAARLRKKDRGIDGEAVFREKGTIRNVIVSVKGGKLKPTDLRDLRGTIEREKAAAGVLVVAQTPSKEMRIEAARAGFMPGVEDAEGPIPRIQIVGLDRLFSDLPPIRCPGKNETAIPAPLVPRHQGSLALGVPSTMSARKKPKPPITSVRPPEHADGESSNVVPIAAKKKR